MAENPLTARDIHSYLSFQQQRASTIENPLTVGDIHFYPSSQPQRASAAENPLTAGDIHSYLSFQPQKASVAKTSLTVKGLHYYLSFQVTDGLSNKNSFYRWAYSSLHQEKASSLEMCTVISGKRGFNQQLPFLPLDMFIFLAARGLSNRLPSLALFITTQRFNIRGLYQQTLIQLGRSIIIQQSNKKGSNRQQPFLPLDMFIFPVAKGLNDGLPFFGCTIIQQFNIRRLCQLGRSIIIQQSNQKRFNRQLPFLPLDMFIFPAAKGLSDGLPFFGCTITQQFNIRRSYQQTLIQLDKSIIIQQPSNKGFDQQ